MITVDTEKCTRCLACVAECPPNIITMENESSLPTIDRDKVLCIRCGHCVAVCPEGALALPFLQPDQCLAFNPEFSISKVQALQWVKARRSIRSYRQKTVAPHILEALFDATRYAPTAKNSQPVRWLLISERNAVEERVELVVRWMEEMHNTGDDSRYPIRLMDKIITDWRKDGNDRICRGAPHLAIAYGEKDLAAAQSGCTIALTTLELLAPAFGVGACWAGYFATAANTYAPLAESLPTPTGDQIYGAIMLGHPTYQYHRIPQRDALQIVRI